MAKRAYVAVEIFYDTIGRVYPKRTTFEGVEYPIDRILGASHGRSSDAGRWSREA